MGMAPYGKPVYYDLIRERLININTDGSIRLNMEYFSFHHGRKMFNRHFEKLFGIEARRPHEPLEGIHFDIAASIQKITEEIILKMAFYAKEITGSKNLCLAGGVSLNCVANGRLLREGPFENLFIQPASGDAGGAMGACLVAYHHYLGLKDRHPLKTVFLGPSFDNDEIKRAIQGNRYEELTDNQIIKRAAELLSEGRVIGWFQGRMEFGPRALGNRSILADPRRPEMKEIVNKKVKFREPFRPFAPAVTYEEAEKYFDINIESPYMLLTAKVLSDRIPAVTHVDGSARLQTVKREDNPVFYELLKEFGRLTGIPVLLNTSFNLKGEPIVCTPEDALKTFYRSGLDLLFMGKYLIKK